MKLRPQTCKELFVNNRTFFLLLNIKKKKKKQKITMKASTIFGGFFGQT